MKPGHILYNWAQINNQPTTDYVLFLLYTGIYFFFLQCYNYKARE